MHTVLLINIIEFESQKPYLASYLKQNMIVSRQEELELWGRLMD